MRRIVEAAVRLADQGGFDGVRLRDVAEAADVALGTLYKYFPSKEDLLLFVVHEGVEAVERHVASQPLRGETASERLADLFERATRGVSARPDLSRAALRGGSLRRSPGRKRWGSTPGLARAMRLHLRASPNQRFAIELSDSPGSTK